MAEDLAVMDEDEVHADRVEAILDAVEAQDAARVTELLEPLHAADIADLLEQIGGADRRALLALWSGEIDGEILSEIDESIREEVIESLPHAVVAEAMRELDTDDVVDILEDLDLPQQGLILDALEDADRVAVQQAMGFPEESAGRLMQREVVVAPEHWTVGEAIDYLRETPTSARSVLSCDSDRSAHETNGLCDLGAVVVLPARGAAEGYSGRQFPHHSGDGIRGRCGLYVQPVSPDFHARWSMRPGGWWG